MTRWFAAASLAALVTASGCGWILGLDEFVDAEPPTAAGGGGGGAGGGPVCEPEATEACYGGPAGTEDVGICKAGTRTCAGDGSGYSECSGEVLPGVEDCYVRGDEDCDGNPCSDALWSHTLGSPGTPTSLAIDSQGNIILAGIFSGSMLPAPHTLTTNGGVDYFLVKFDSGGSIVWAKSFGDANDNGYSIKIALDLDDNIAIVGTLLGSINFGGNTLVDPADGNWGLFAASLDAGGSHRWSKNIGSGADFELANTATTDFGRLIITGTYFGTTSFGDATFTTAGYDIFLASFDLGSGAHQWSRTFGDVPGQPPSDQGRSTITINHQGEIFLAGQFTTSINLGGSSSLTHQGNSGFVARFSSANGTTAWSKKLAGCTIESVNVDSANNVLVTGKLEASTDFGGGNTLQPEGIGDIFAVKYGNTGNHYWSERFGEFNTNTGIAIAADAPSNDITLLGMATGTVNFGGQPLVAQPPSDIVIAKLNAAGTHLWSKVFGDDQGQTPAAMGITPGTGEIVIAGTNSGAVDFGDGPLDPGMFVVKIAP